MEHSARIAWQGFRMMLRNAVLTWSGLWGKSTRRTQKDVLNYYNHNWILSQEGLRERYLHPRLMVIGNRFVKANTRELDILQIGEHYRAIRQVFPVGNDPQRVLEVGAGVGRNLCVLSRVFPQSEFWGLEYSTAGPENARHWEQLMHEESEAVATKIAPHGPKAPLVTDFRSGDAKNMPYEDKFFDVTFTNLVLEQIAAPEDHDRALREIQRVTRRGRQAAKHCSSCPRKAREWKAVAARKRDDERGRVAARVGYWAFEAIQFCSCCWSRKPTRSPTTFP